MGSNSALIVGEHSAEITKRQQWRECETGGHDEDAWRDEL